MDECVKQYTQKYRSRASPPFPANKCQKRQMRGNDGLMYSSVPDKNGVHRWQLSKDEAEILTWDQLCSSNPPTPIGLESEKFNSLLKHGVWLKDAMDGICTSYRSLTLQEKKMSGVRAQDIQIREIQVPFMKALLPEKTAELLLSKISNTIAYKIEAVYGDQVIKYRSARDDYIPLRYSCARAASGETHIVDADFDLEPVSALQKIIQQEGAGISTLSSNIRERAFNDDMLQRQIVYLYLIGKPCDGRNLVNECFDVLASERNDILKDRFIAKSMTRGAATTAAALPKRFVAPPPQPQVQSKEIDAKTELDAMTVFSMNNFETKRQTAYPSDNDVGVLIVTQPTSSAEFTIKFVLNGRHDVIERTYKADKAAGKTIFGRIFLKGNDLFVGLVGAN